MSSEPQPSASGGNGSPLKRLPLVLAGILLLLGGIGTAAYAFWESLSSGNFAAAAADALTPGAQPAVTANGTDLTVTWPAGSTTGGRPATGYTVTRYAAATGGSGIPATGACAGTVTALSCTEQNVSGGVWYYTVTPAIALWNGGESPRSNGVSNDATPPVATVVSISPAPNAAGWNNTSPVTVNISAQDAAGGSGVASITYAIDSAAPVTVNTATAAVPVSGDGSHTVSYFATDNVGNAGTPQNQAVRIDTAAPAAPSLSVPTYVNSANVAAVPVSGTAEAGATVTLTATDASSLHTVTVATTASGTGAWSYGTLNLTTFSQGTLSYTAKATDPAGNTGLPTTATDTKDTIAPAAPTLTVPAYVNSANVAAVPVSGTAEAGATVTLTVTDAGSAHTVSAATTASGTGAWSFSTLNLTTLNQGTLSYTAKATDPAGNTGSPATATDTKDTIPPAAPTLTVPAYVNSANVAAVPVSGTAEAGASVSLTIRDVGSAHTVPAATTASGTGTWSFSTLNLTTLNDGTLTYTVTAADPAGNTGSPTTATDKKDVVAPTVIGFTLLNGTGSPKSNAAIADKGDTVTIRYAEGMDPAKFCPGWSGSSALSGTVTITNGGTGGANDTLSMSGTGCSTLTIGTMTLGGDYIGATAAVFGTSGNGNASTLTWDSALTTLTIKLGTLSSGTPLSPVTAGTPSYTPATSLTDAAGNPLSTTFYSSGTSGF
ncbi:OmpL47-type beta-barrel domain-containing protein [Pseudarthrobacter sp. N5]|uniref:OmpL47-type beta-barrel domain-containing protein n=1 Tax=Pseudarthrobacter sp. N5 TaxID=3418416 RepID=UPI003CF3584F